MIGISKFPSVMLRRSIWVYHLNTGACNGCDIEVTAAFTPRFDLERFGVKLVGTPRHADVLLVTGPVTRQAALRIKRIYEQVPRPKLVVAVGTCACTAGIFQGSYAVCGPVRKIIPVDYHILGCPPRPHAIVYGLLKALKEFGRGGRG